MNLMLIHGFLERKEMWDSLLPILPENARVVCQDLPGHGANNDLLEQDSIGEYVNFLDQKLQEEQIDQVILVGHSMGGYIACEFIKRFPEKTMGLVLFHSTASEDDAEKKTNRDRAIKLVLENKSKYCSGMISGLFPKDTLSDNEGIVQQLIAQAMSMNSGAITQALNSMKQRPDSISALKARRFPLAYVLGDRDPHLSMDKMSLEMQETKPEFECILKDCGHMGQWEHPGQSSQAILNAIRQFEDSSTGTAYV